MLNSQDLKQIRNVVKDEIDASANGLRKEIEKSTQGLRKEIAGSAEGLRKEVKASADQVKSELRAEIKESEGRIYEGIGNLISDGILPQLAEKADKSDIDRIERKIDKIIAKDLEQDEEIRQLRTQVRSTNP